MKSVCFFACASVCSFRVLFLGRCWELLANINSKSSPHQLHANLRICSQVTQNPWTASAKCKGSSTKTQEVGSNFRDTSSTGRSTFKFFKYSHKLWLMEFGKPPYRKFQGLGQLVPTLGFTEFSSSMNEIRGFSMPLWILTICIDFGRNIWILFFLLSTRVGLSFLMHLFAVSASAWENVSVGI